MENSRFLELVEREKGFEFYQAFRDEVDWAIGGKALDVSEAYGVSIGYSDLKDIEAGFHLRSLSTGGDVKLPD
ncbi:MAG: hypothetical protein II488_02525 [Firmicutes bacterium]|nr:hypothetical protein [Bacillota bacterium]MBQ4372392.1 hypothetical protein [Bacillota bacterium]